jgi:hypothetical protein
MVVPLGPHLGSRSSRGSFRSPSVGVVVQFAPTPGLLFVIVFIT